MIILQGKKQEVQNSEPTGADNAWMLAKTTEFKKLDQVLMSELNPEEYLNNPGFNEGTDPNTFVNKKKNFLEQTLGSDLFTAPTAAAKSMWDNFKNVTTSKSISAGIGIEATTRHQEVTKSLRNMVDNLAQYPTKENLQESLLNLDTYAGSLELDSQYLPPGTTSQMVSESRQNLANTYLSSYLKEDPVGVMDDLHDNKQFWKSLGLSEGDLVGHYDSAIKQYKVLAEKDTLSIISMLRDNFEKIQNNGGSISVTELAKMKPNDFTQDQFIMKLGMLLPWFENNMKPNAPRTKNNESQRTATSERDGITYLYPTIRFNENGSQIELEDPFQYALDQGDALVVKDNAQGTRISRYMSRVLK